MQSKNFKQVKHFIKSSQKLCFLSQLGETDNKVNYSNDLISFFIPLCPDYSFEVSNNSERVHDFSGMGDEVGIVYEKLINITQAMFDFLNKSKIKYTATFLMADVEVTDKLILRKLKISESDFINKCASSTKKISVDLKKRGIKGICLGMEEYFKSKTYQFHKVKELNYQKIKDAAIDKRFLEKVIELRKGPYKFWFDISDEECIERAYKDIGMYAAFAEEPSIANGIILCADSEILSCCYNIFKSDKNNSTTVIYVKGGY